jgi:hypothetical protein
MTNPANPRTRSAPQTTEDGLIFEFWVGRQLDAEWHLAMLDRCFECDRRDAELMLTCMMDRAVLVKVFDEGARRHYQYCQMPRRGMRWHR